MALQKQYEKPDGSIGDYWRIDTITLERRGRMLEARLNLYKSKADRQGGKHSMGEQKILTLDIPAMSTTLSGLLDYIYAEALTNPTNDQAHTDTPFFEGATEV